MVRRNQRVLLCICPKNAARAPTARTSETAMAGGGTADWAMGTVTMVLTASTARIRPPSRAHFRAAGTISRSSVYTGSLVVRSQTASRPPAPRLAR